MGPLTSPPHIRSLYRSFLRELPLRHPPSSSPLHQRLRAAFSEPSPTNTGPSTASLHRRVLQADQYLQYVRAQRAYLTLLERYNPGIALEAGLGLEGAVVGDEEDAGRVRATARRVGMKLPGEWQR